jgi:hypothetical protein
VNISSVTSSTFVARLHIPILISNALTQGIFSVKGELDDQFPSMVCVKQEYTYMVAYHGEGKEWHRTEDEAKAKAENMRVVNIAH